MGTQSQQRCNVILDSFVAFSYDDDSTGQAKRCIKTRRRRTGGVRLGVNDGEVNTSANGYVDGEIRDSHNAVHLSIVFDVMVLYFCC